MRNKTDTKGSIWRKWDLHIHTPLTKLGDNFNLKFTKNLVSQSLDAQKWEFYIKHLDEQGISVAGITDYFSIDNFEKAIEAKVKLRSNITLLPNIEFRIGQKNKDSEFIQLHVIFSNDSKIVSKIKDFLNRLPLISTDDTTLTNKYCNQIDLSEISYKKAMINESKLLEKLEEDFVSVDDYLIFGVARGYGSIRPAKDDDGRGGEYAKEIDKLCHGFFGNKDDVFFYLSEEGPRKKLGLKPKPILLCSDSHSYEEIGTKFTWIKSDPSYEGLKQILYEPEQRVRIQEVEPNPKPGHFIINRIRFIDESDTFGNQEILFNPNLNSIIGGKSSGKSLLLHTIAETIDPEQVSRTSEKLKFNGYPFQFDFEVIWGDESVDSHNEREIEKKSKKITYIPQLYINYLAERNNKEELNSLIKNILLQDEEFRQFYHKKAAQIQELTVKLDRLLNEHIKCRDDGKNLKDSIVSNGGNLDTSRGSVGVFIETDIEQLEKTAKSLRIKSSLTEQDSTQFAALTQQKAKNSQSIESLNKDRETIEQIIKKVKEIQKDLFEEYLGFVQNIRDDNLSKTKDFKKYLKQEYENFITVLNVKKESYELDNEIVKLEASNISIEQELKPYNEKLEDQKELQSILTNIDTQRKKYSFVHSQFELYQEKRNKFQHLKNNIVKTIDKRTEIYNEIIDEVNTSRQSIDKDIKLKAVLLYKKNNFQLFHQVSKNKLAQDHYFFQLFEEPDNVKIDKISSIFNDILNLKGGILTLSQNRKIPIRDTIELDDILQGIIADNYEIDYDLTYKGDAILNMSPGKKGTVLLILFLKISTDKYPILIDQPEDNLDNRTIYTQLSAFIREKKLERQIIIVSHNANLVVSTDSENIIVANHAGQDITQENEYFYFEYCNGPLENSFLPKKDTKAILIKQGIRQHVCDILEGGDEAFLKRENKYGLRKR